MINKKVKSELYSNKVLSHQTIFYRNLLIFNTANTYNSKIKNKAVLIIQFN